MATNWFYARLLPRTAQFCRLILLDTRTRSFHSGVKGERLVIRLANQGDSEQMLKLSERIQDEFDYLPYRFHKWLKEPNRITVVAEMERQLVGNMGFSIVDGGKSVVIEAGRVDPRYRGRRIGASMKNFGNEIISQIFPNVIRTRYSSWVEALQVIRKAYQTHNDKELSRYDFLTYQVAPDHVNLNSKLQNCSNLQQFTKKEFRDRILVNAEESFLFPNNILVIDWRPFEAIPSNIDYIVEDRDRLFVESTTSCGNLPKSFSLGRFFPVTCGNDRSATEHCKNMLENIPGVTSVNGDESNQKMVIFESGAL
ncbi:Acetyltransferase (GNAT) [Desmophyllum pertusum]|uniref:Acetyltransferase (GNAT) n=1 Tax=Desmophyllum pertusum TaxID=174260 RepID=A0A9W9ZJH9_9CNID|nr:Acetyltransferase (GNAT) [Desmophyllum pertusum]